MPANLLKTHWAAYEEGAASVGRKADRRNWRIARSMVIADSDAEARDYLAGDSCSPGWYYGYLRDVLAMHKLLKIFKPDESIPDEALTIQKCLEFMVVSGSARTVTDKLVAMVDLLGPFGMLLITQKDWDRPDIHKKSMRLLAEQVMPKLRQHVGAAMAAE
jgi:alkanesulfonate monooxygenase SsuD/methylene tetrahydromethanopterin reductase-like flavin-dependent oxidoreductase (luciferase family)